MSLKDRVLKIENIEDILRCVNLASLLELSGYPKPGNVHRNKDFNNTRFEHFLAGIAAIQPSFKNFCERVFHEPNIDEGDYSKIKLGLFFQNAAEQMMKWQKGGNVLLGHILILGPLLAAATISLRRKKFSFVFFIKTIQKVIEDSTIEDTILLYQAIRKCNPGGLGTINKYDLNDNKAFTDLENDQMNLKKIFDFSKDSDLISLEYSTGYNIILNEGLPYYFKVFEETDDINTATVNLFLKILSQHPDTLIIRKSGLKKALEVSELTQKIINFGGISSKKGLEMVMDLDSQLQMQRGRLNPGTTADLIAGTIFCALLFGLRY